MAVIYTVLLMIASAVIGYRLGFVDRDNMR